MVEGEMNQSALRRSGWECSKTSAGGINCDLFMLKPSKKMFLRFSSFHANSTILFLFVLLHLFTP